MFQSLMCAIALLITPMTLAYDIIPAPSDVTYGDGLTTNLVANFHMLPKRGKAYVKGSYTMDITKNGVMIVTYDPESRRNAMSTLAQLRDELRRNPQGIPVGKILDAPRYQWRGYMLDVSRHYMPIEDIKLIVDELAHYKFNRRTCTSPMIMAGVLRYRATLGSRPMPATALRAMAMVSLRVVSIAAMSCKIL